MLASKYFFLIAAFLCYLSRALAVTCADDSTDANCIDCTTDPTNEECTEPTTTTTTTVAPPSTSTTTARTPHLKEVSIKNMKLKVLRKIKRVFGLKSILKIK
ncbi:uncharacterized protein LOC108139103 [Drosophila elegans]|uniref:uncharacterized protein LOC108139103 n=1 Tax=Drosophila elegans TaxID=30023 RepID=UPI0007E7A6F0|nr:uncharacterized protein LOC108139103 [Drosophila elegans]